MATIIKLEDVSKSFYGQLLYTSVNFRVQSGEKILLYGENGCGKTTLVRILLQEIEPDQGTVTISPGLTVAKLDQYPVWEDDYTVQSYIDTIFGRVFHWKVNCGSLNNDLRMNFKRPFLMNIIRRWIPLRQRVAINSCRSEKNFYMSLGWRMFWIGK